MVKTKLKLFLSVVILMAFSSVLNANPNTDQWLESEKTYKDLINEGFEVKSYAISDIEVAGGLIIILLLIFLKPLDTGRLDKIDMSFKK